MSEPWSREYILLALRIDKAFRHVAGSWFVDYYYGPREWKVLVETEPALPAPQLVRAAGALADSLPTQGFEQHRATYLGKQVVAMEVVCRKLSGETFPLEEEVQRCFDIHAAWTPEARFEQALALYDEALPGMGHLRDRFLAWHKHVALTWEQTDLIYRALAEARSRTRTFVNLPPDENVEVQMVTGKTFRAANWYLGNYHSRIELNTDFPIDALRLMNLMCHEGYPGHHVEAVLKEQQVYRTRDYREQAIFPIISPQLVISEGIAMLAFHMLFAPGELEHWFAEQLSFEQGIEVDGADMVKLRQAEDMLKGVEGNALFLVREGRSSEEVLHYLMHYSLESEEQVRKQLQRLQHPLMDTYIFTYFYGKQLMEPWLQGSDRKAVFQRFLSEQLSPSALVQVR